MVSREESVFCMMYRSNHLCRSCWPRGVRSLTVLTMSYPFTRGVVPFLLISIHWPPMSSKNKKRKQPSSYRRITECNRKEATRSCRKLRNEELHYLYSLSHIIRLIKLSGVGWTGHTNTHGGRWKMSWPLPSRWMLRESVHCAETASTQYCSIETSTGIYLSTPRSTEYKYNTK
jgi:hypothetical protein